MEREIIEKYSDKIYNIVKRMSYCDRDDLFQAGCMGLIKAYRNYNSDKGEFFSYAYKYILGEIKANIRENRNIKVSRELYSLKGKIEEARNIVSQKLMRNPTIQELASFLEISVDEITFALSTNYSTTSLDRKTNDDDKDMCFYDVIPNVEILEKEDLLTLKTSLEKLDENDRKIINLRYMSDYTQQETANIMGMSQVQVSRKESKVLQKLNKEMAA